MPAHRLMGDGEHTREKDSFAGCNFDGLARAPIDVAVETQGCPLTVGPHGKLGPQDHAMDGAVSFGNNQPPKSLYWAANPQDLPGQLRRGTFSSTSSSEDAEEPQQCMARPGNPQESHTALRHERFGSTDVVINGEVIVRDTQTSCIPVCTELAHAKESAAWLDLKAFSSMFSFIKREVHKQKKPPQHPVAPLGSDKFRSAEGVVNGEATKPVSSFRAACESSQVGSTHAAVNSSLAPPAKQKALNKTIAALCQDALVARQTAQRASTVALSERGPLPCSQEPQHQSNGPAKALLNAARFDSTKAVLNDAAAPAPQREALHEAVAALWHDALTGSPMRAEEAAAVTPLSACLPFPCSRQLQHGDGRFINVAVHSSRFECPQAIVVLLPGVFGGVGPCRSPGNDFDERALFPLLAEELSQGYAIDCHRASWMVQNPTLEEATHAVCRLVFYALTVAKTPMRDGKRKVILVGHSFGAAVAIRVAAQLKQEMLVNAQAEVAGVAVLAAQTAGAQLVLHQLETVPKLIFHGADDEVFPCRFAVHLYHALPPPKALCILAPCEHHFFQQKTYLLEELLHWIVKHGMAEGDDVPPRAERAPSDKEGLPAAILYREEPLP